MSRRDKEAATMKTIPLLTKQDGTTATSSKEKAKLAELFSTKMSIPDPSSTDGIGV